MNRAYLLTGGNLGDREGNLSAAINKLSQDAGSISAVSFLYETAAWGVDDQPDYLNQALLIETRLSAEALLTAILKIEKQLGRLRQVKYGPRVIDIDILFFNNDIVKHPDLTIPHPHIQQRRFVLAPLAEIAPGYEHPVLKQTVATLLQNCPDPLNVKKFYPGNAIKQVDL